MKVYVAAAAFLTAALVGGMAWAEAPVCAGDVEIGDAHINRVEHNGMLILTDGRALKLEGLRIPAAAQDRAPPTIADAAFAELNSLAKGQVVNAHAIWPKEDRYDHVRAQIFAPDGTWLQTDLLSKGLARVELSPDRGECYRELYDAEIAARAAHIGLWADAAYAVRTADNVAADIGTFQIVMGTVLNATAKDGRVYLNFGQDWKTDFTVTISPDDMQTFRRLGVDPLGYQGKLIRVRGMVQSLNGPEIEIGNPKQIEVLQ